LNKARVDEKKAELASKGDDANFADIQNRLRRAQAEEREAKRKEQVAQN